MTTALSKRTSYVDPTAIAAVHQRELTKRVILNAKAADAQFDLSEDGAMRKFFPAIEGHTPNGLFERFMGPVKNAILVAERRSSEPHAPSLKERPSVDPTCVIH